MERKSLLSEEDVKRALFIIRKKYARLIWTEFGIYIAVLMLHGGGLEDIKAWSLIRKIDRGEVVSPQRVVDLAKKFAVAVTLDPQKPYAVTSTMAIDLILDDEQK